MEGNEKYVFGSMGLPDGENYEIRGAVLSYIPNGMLEKFKEVMIENEIPQEKGQALWDYLSDKIGQAYDTWRLSQETPQPMTRDDLDNMKFDFSEFWTDAEKMGFTEDEMTTLSSEYQIFMTDFAEAQVEAYEQYEQQQQEQTGQTGETGQELSDEALDQVIEQIRQDPAYMGEGVPQEKHDRAVFAMNKAMAMRANKIPRTLDAIDEYVSDFKQEQAENLKESYGTNLYKSGDKSSSFTPEQPTADEGDRDGIAQAQDAEGVADED